MNINTAFRSIFGTDINLISEHVPIIQLEINAEHNARNIGTGSVNNRIVATHDDLMQQALTRRQL